jgi:leucyl-tRNA synthetase
MNSYDHKAIEAKWQKQWADANLFKTPDTPGDKMYLLVEFPYPSGNLHVGHWYAFAVTDIFARYMHHVGKDVLFPIGFDSFGLPAENAAIKRGLNPKDWTYSNIDFMVSQIKSMGGMFDWNRKVVTSDPEYYKWTQWLFLQFYKKGLVKHEKTHVNWCPSCKTVLANEQLEGGVCERCGSTVEQKEMMQWNIEITKYADRLIDDLNAVEWPSHIKEAQKNWIGRSSGTFFEFPIVNSNHKIKVFTTRADTFYGVTYVVLAPEHPLLQELMAQITNWEEVVTYTQKTNQKTDLERQTNKDKTGVRLGGVVVTHPATREQIPVFISDYVLAHYGTGAVMAVPAHDERDFEFAQKFGMEVRKVIDSESGTLPFTGTGALVSSSVYDGLITSDAKEKITEAFGTKATTYKLQNWSVSRQRYWGCPIPMVHCDSCGTVPVAESELPVRLPEMDKIEMRDDGKSPLAHNTEWVNTICPTCGGIAHRETDTLDTFVDSSWYYARYADPLNETEFASRSALDTWMPVDFYSGGSEHTTRHLLYARFVYKVMHDLGLVPQSEPFMRRNNRGLILGPDGEKMSKSKGNVIEPDPVVELVGADVVRAYLAFIGPYGEAGNYPWDPNGVVGIRRFFERIYGLKEKISTNDSGDALLAINTLLKQVPTDFEQLKFNTALSKTMICLNVLEKTEFSKQTFAKLLVVLNPFAPHVGFIHSETFPIADESVLAHQSIKIAVQINGKTRSVIECEPGTDKDTIIAVAKADSEVAKWLDGKEILKEVYVENRLLSIVTKG